MGYKTIYCQVIYCYAKHCRSMVKKPSTIYLLLSCHQSIFVEDNSIGSDRILLYSLPLFLIPVFRRGGNVLVTLLRPKLA
mgnify:CR=1 FL=1